MDIDIIKKEYTYTSANGVCDIYAYSWVPADSSKVVAVFQIAHAISENSQNYEEFARFLCGKGYAVYINDQLGHGKSIKCNDDLGHFGEKDGWKALVKDAKKLTDIALLENKDKPVILFGNSIGSFIVRRYCQKYGKDINGAIFCATSGSNPGDKIAIKLSEFVANRKGSNHRSEFMNNVALARYNIMFKFDEQPPVCSVQNENTEGESTPEKECGLVFTAAGYKDLLTLIHSVSKKKWYKNIPYTLPILILSGSLDPVGDYGKGVKQVYKDLRNTGHNDVTFKLYDGLNHELLKEANYMEIYKDIVVWADALIKK